MQSSYHFPGAMTTNGDRRSSLLEGIASTDPASASSAAALASFERDLSDYQSKVEDWHRDLRDVCGSLKGADMTDVDKATLTAYGDTGDGIGGKLYSLAYIHRCQISRIQLCHAGRAATTDLRGREDFGRAGQASHCDRTT